MKVKSKGKPKNCIVNHNYCMVGNDGPPYKTKLFKQKSIDNLHIIK